MSSRQRRVHAHSARWLAFQPRDAARRANLLCQKWFLRQRRFGKRRRRGAKRTLQRFEYGIRGCPLLGLRQTLNPVKERYRNIVDDKRWHGMIHRKYGNK